jgi:outer membrane protein
MEDLVSAARNYSYARRAFAFGRLTLLVDTVQAFFGLLQQESSIRNFERALERSRQLARQADINEKFGRVTRTDVFRSQLEVTRAESALNDARERMALARNAFKVDLGLAPDTNVELVAEFPRYAALELTRDEAVELALANNPAWLNTRDAVEDARRALALATDNTLPQFDVTAGYTLTTGVEREVLEGYDVDQRTWSLGGVFSIPIDRTALRRDYQVAVIAYRQAERDFSRARDRVIRDVDAQLILLRQTVLSIELQKRAISDAEKAEKLARYDYQRGRVTNRDVIEAQDRLLEAQNAYQAAEVTAHVAKLRLLQFIGRLEADEQGRLK